MTQQPLQLGDSRISQTPTFDGVMMEKPISKTVVRDEKGRIKSGALNPTGKRNYVSFAKRWEMFVDKIALQNGATPEDIDNQLYKVAYKMMESGDFRYWKDIQDRLHGQANSKVELSGKVETVQSISDGAVNEIERKITDEYNEKIREAIALSHGKPLPKPENSD